MVFINCNLCNNEDSQNIIPIRSQFGDVSYNRKDKTLQENDKLIAHALGQLSLEEREKACYDIHGVSDEVSEEPEFVEKKLNETRDALLKIKAKLSAATEALRLAETINPAYVDHRKFLLTFLRVDLFDAEKAAGRIARYLDWKLSLFGREKLCKPITLDDLQKEDLTILKKGYFQMLPERDGAGRAVWVVLHNNQLYPNMDSFVSTGTVLR
jgi:hypothetical protein